jgi:hypothetical protein
MARRPQDVPDVQERRRRGDARRVNFTPADAMSGGERV